jgi:hypothetical protein
MKELVAIYPNLFSLVSRVFIGLDICRLGKVTMQRIYYLIFAAIFERVVQDLEAVKRISPKVWNPKSAEPIKLYIMYVGRYVSQIQKSILRTVHATHQLEINYPRRNGLYNPIGLYHQH